VNKHWGSAHRDNPPEREKFVIECVPLEPSLVNRFWRVAGSISFLEVNSTKAGDQVGYLPQLLTAAAFSALRLRRLSIPLRGRPLINSLSMLTNLTYLELSVWQISADDNVQLLVGLSSLQVGFSPLIHNPFHLAGNHALHSHFGIQTLTR